MSQIPQKELLKLRGCACFGLRKSARAVTQLYDRILRPSGLRGTQFTLLAVAAQNESMSISNLADILVMERTTLTRNLRPLEKQGLVKIEPGQDPRSRQVSLTAAGGKRLAAALPLWDQAQALLTEGMGQPPLQRLLASLEETVAIAKAV
ncbi:MAG: winged helix-turn-helix transcriptional regulator [Gemmatimonadetes bacterium]|jgi:DNA-binding MarR family transcriptional regulator|nr:winged helix-turn-helix transcriptional regulator [Gemmatimonadota bacterium]